MIELYYEDHSSFPSSVLFYYFILFFDWKLRYSAYSGFSSGSIPVGFISTRSTTIKPNFIDLIFDGFCPVSYNRYYNFETQSCNFLSVTNSTVRYYFKLIYNIIPFYNKSSPRDFRNKNKKIIVY